MIAADGLASRPTRSRSAMSKARLIFSNTPLSRHVENQRYTVRHGGKSLGKSRRAVPPRSTQKMALTISRGGRARGRPWRHGPGRRGSITCHSPSLRSVPWRNPSRPCRRRVVGVHIATPNSASTTVWNHDGSDHSTLFETASNRCFRPWRASRLRISARRQARRTTMPRYEECRFCK